MMATKMEVCILTKEMFGEGKPEKEGEDPWECMIFRGELVVEIPEKEWLLNKEGKPFNYQLLTGPDIIKLHAELTDVSPLQEDEVPYLLAVQPPGVRFKEYLRENRKKEIMALKVEDVVMFKLDQVHNNTTSIIRGKIRYIGPIDDDEGIFFGIEIIVSIINNIVNNLVNICRIKSNEVEVLLMVDHILIVVTIMLYM